MPSYWKNQDLSQPFDEKIKLSKSDLEQVQKLLEPRNGLSLSFKRGVWTGNGL